MVDLNSSICNLLALAKEKDAEYNWLEAIALYRKASDQTSLKRDSRAAADIEGKIGCSFYQLAFQADSSADFNKYIGEAIKAYENAIEHLKRQPDSLAQSARIFHYQSMISYVNHWLSPDPKTGAQLLDQCRTLGRRALEAYSMTRDKRGVAKACISLATCMAARLDLEHNGDERANILDEALSFGEKAIRIFSELGEEKDLAEAYYMTGVHCYHGAMSHRLEVKIKECERKAFQYANAAIKIAESSGDELLLGESLALLGFVEQDLGAGPKTSSNLFERAVESGLKTGNKAVLSEAFDGLTLATYWSMIAEEDLEKMRQKSTQCKEYANRAITVSTPIHYSRRIPHSYSWGTNTNLSELAQREIDIETKRKLLEEAISSGRQGLALAQQNGSTHAVFHLSTAMVQSLYYLSIMKTGEEKRKLLEEGRKLGEQAVVYTEQLRPHFLWPRVLSHEALALILLELSKIEKKDEKRKEFLENSASNMETSTTLFEKHVSSALAPSRKDFLALLGRLQTELGNILNQLYLATAEKKVLRKLIKTFQRAIQMNREAGLSSWAAEAHWQIAVAYDRLGEYLESATSFKSASEEYMKSAQTTPQLESFYGDYVSYMEGWSNVEEARYYHARNNYRQAQQHYEKAAKLYESTKSWKYLGSNYLAWAQLEDGAHLSRSGQTQDSIRAFQKAAELFRRARSSLENKLDSICCEDENDSVKDLIDASDTRERYSVGRKVLEEAIILDRKGDHIGSSEQFAHAAKIFGNLAKAAPEPSRKEFASTALLCEAWQKMTMAAATASSAMYGEAAELFKHAKEQIPDETTSLLALANSSLCKALEAGTEFESSRDMAMYSTAKKHMEAAQSYYLRAGLEAASEFTKATERLFDAYIYMNRAETETEPAKKTQYYEMAEKLLQASAGSYAKAQHPKKIKEVQRLLQSVKEERQLATSLAEILRAHEVASSTTSLITPSQNQGEAVGLESLRANVQANLTLMNADIKVAEDFKLKVQFMNVGKEPVLLLKIEDLIPDKFELIGKPDYANYGDRALDINGKKLEPFGTEEITLVLRSLKEGAFKTKPRLIYMNEAGSQLISEPEPVTFNVSRVILPGRNATGVTNLDYLLMGGIPRGYALVLTSTPCDEKDLLIRRYLKTGAKAGEPTFYVTTDPGEAAALVEEFQSNFHMIICNPQADAIVKSLPNVVKLPGVENLTDISIALTSTLRKLNASKEKPGRACIEILSDVLLQHHAVQTRRWLGGLIPELRSKGLITLALIDPHMHPPEEVQAILGLFEGIVDMHEKETGEGSKRLLKIRKMTNQEYLKSELPVA